MAPLKIRDYLCASLPDIIWSLRTHHFASAAFSDDTKINNYFHS